MSIPGEVVERARDAHRLTLGTDESPERHDNAMRAALEAVMGGCWIKCSERMPEGGAPVYICRRGRVSAAVRDSDVAAFRNLIGGHVYYDHNVGDVSHWMARPLPQAPSRDEGRSNA